MIVKNKFGDTMFYQLDDEIISIEYDNIKDNTIAVGLISVSELENIYRHFDLPLRAVELCKKGISPLSAGVEIYDNCSFVSLSFVSTMGIFITKNAIIVVSIDDTECINRNAFMKMLSRIHCDSISLERCFLILLDTILSDDNTKLEEFRIKITELEKAVITDNADHDFNITLLALKQEILSFRSYYERLIDIIDALEENDNDLLDVSKKQFRHFSSKLERLKDNTVILTDNVIHLWDAYQASMEMSLNNTMKIFTLVTTIFFPLTVIVGWYGMNFSFMPELKWKYGYLYVIVLSVAVITALVLWFKKRKWI